MTGTPLPIFSDPWARACAEQLAARPGYRHAAAAWEGALILELAGDGFATRRVWLDLWHGECREARAARDGDEAGARYIMSGSLAAWRSVLVGNLAPLMAVMTGKLRLTKGSIAELLPHVQSAKELLAAAREVKCIFPDDPG